MRTRRYKYTVKGDKFGGKPWQFFDLEEDPGEMRNLMGEVGVVEEVGRCYGLLWERLNEAGDPFVLLPGFGRHGVNTWECSAQPG